MTDRRLNDILPLAQELNDIPTLAQIHASQLNDIFPLAQKLNGIISLARNVGHQLNGSKPLAQCAGRRLDHMIALALQRR